jgi:hypothetical protein
VRVGSPSNTPTAAAAAFYISFFFSLIPHADNSTLSLVSIVFFSSNFSPSFRDYGGNCLTGGRESIWVVASNSWLGICTQSICTIPTGFRLAQIFVFRTWIFYPPQSRSHAEIRGEPFGCLGETFQLHPNVCRRRRLAFLSLWLRDTCTCCCTFWGFELANKTSSSSSFGGLDTQLSPHQSIDGQAYLFSFSLLGLMSAITVGGWRRTRFNGDLTRLSGHL